ncbi:MAG: hypothetical protein R3B72_30880 [Polyangiaceae bacterium]
MQPSSQRPPPTSQGPGSLGAPSFGPPPPKGHSRGVVVAIGAVALLAGVGIGAGAMLMTAGETGPGPEPSASTAPESEASAEPTDEPSAEPSAPETPVPVQPRVDPKLVALRKKVKQTRAKQLDEECVKYNGKTFGVGYLFQGGTFDENRYVAGASGCKALASAAKAPWFCCAR